LSRQPRRSIFYHGSSVQAGDQTRECVSASIGVIRSDGQRAQSSTARGSPLDGTSSSGAADSRVALARDSRHPGFIQFALFEVARISRARRYGVRQAGEPRDFNPIAARRRLLDYAAQEKSPRRPFAHCHAEILYPRRSRARSVSSWK